MSAPLHKLIADHLRSRPRERLTLAEIASALIRLHPERFAQKARSLAGRTTIEEQVTREVYATRRAVVRNNRAISLDPSRRPQRLFFDPDGDSIEAAHTSPAANELEPAKKDARPGHLDSSEHALYAPLQRFLFQELNIVSKRIREGTSSNRRGRGGNKWLHPDIVGMLAPSQAWSEIVKKCSTELPTSKAKLVAVEVKRRLTVGTIREAFFQAVSNSLWANRGYLAAAEIDAETLEELNMLCSLHGVGYIAIDPENAVESQILIHARERDEVDWASANRIAEENADFTAFLDHVLNYLRSGKVMLPLWEHTQDQDSRG
jgi:hypothetical protein